MSYNNGSGSGFRGWLQRKRQQFSEFMYGRNGIDELYRFIFWVIIILAVLNIFIFKHWVIDCIELLLLICALFRVFSKNVYRRQKENRFYLDTKAKIKVFFAKIKKRIANFIKLQKNRWRDRKTHVYKRCPQCKNVLRLPKSKGKHTVACPCCEHRFDIKIL